jgi:outer membrane protein OmpA-like peptidoglycan-associated protein
MGSAPRRSPEPNDSLSAMANAPDSQPPLEPPDEPSANGEQPYQELRHLILAPEQEALERLHQRVASPESRTEDVSSVVAEAIQLRRRQGGDDALSDALAPTIETALRESVRKDPGTLADALFPVMGPAIRRSILETLRSFLDSFNQIMDQSLSWQGLKWRVEALRTGRSFTEVVLLHSLVFRVEQVFLIHKKTGLSLGHVVAPAVAMQDPSLVSGMLTAIQDFVRDSFHSQQGQSINRMDVGELEVWVEEGPYASLACVIRGVAPRALRDKMAEALENVHRQYAAELDAFRGDTAVFTTVNAELSRCLDFKYKDERMARGRGYVWAAAGLVILLLGGWLGARWWQYHRWSRVVETLREQPGLVITSFGREGGRFVIRGLRDPLANDPQENVKSTGLDPGKADFHWGAYYALDDAIVQQRATLLLSPPHGLRLEVRDGVLRLSGVAPGRWINEIQARALLVPGIRRVDLSGEFSPEQIAFNLAKSDIQDIVVKFPVGSAELSATNLAALRNLIPKLRTVLDAPVTLHQSTAIEVVGHSDSTGAETTNESLSQHRADRVAQQLAQFGLLDKNVRAEGVSTAEPLRSEDSEGDRQYNRSVTFRVISSGTP